MNQENEKIPYGRPVRIGNFRLWKCKYLVSSDPTEEQRRKVRQESGGRMRLKRQKAEMECINVSSLDGSWSVRIPAAFQQYGMIDIAYAWTKDEDESVRKRGMYYLTAVLSNMYYVSCISNGFYHQGVQMVTAAYSNPSILRDEKLRASFLDDASGTVDRFLSWRDEYDRKMAENEPTDSDIRQEEIAEEAIDILAGEKIE